MRFVEIAAGAFEMGAVPGENWQKRDDAGPHWDEAPVHRVQLSRSFVMGVAEVTNAQFELFAPEHRRLRDPAARDDVPVQFVSWHDAVDFCAWLSAREGRHYRLPTEAEWEYACRAGTQTAFYSGEKPPVETSGAGQDPGRPNSANGWGLQGMHDGVAEWCHDWWAPYDGGEQMDPSGPAYGDVRVIRGGGSGEEESYRRSANRQGTVPGDRHRGLGFRVVMGHPLPRPASPSPARPAMFTGVSREPARWSRLTEPFMAGAVVVFGDVKDPRGLPYFGRSHVPSITWCDNGDLLATAFSAPADNSRQMVILISRLRAGAARWEPPQRFFCAPDRNVTSSVLFSGKQGELHHYNGLGDPFTQERPSYAMLKRTSTDHGASWSTFRIVHRRPSRPATLFDFSGEPRLWPHMDPFVMEDGTMVISSDVAKGSEGGTALFASRDDGETWTELTRYGWNHPEFARDGGQAGWVAGIHSPVVRLRDGRLLGFGRGGDIAGRAPMSTSRDGGRSWTYAPSPFPPLHSSQRPVLNRLAEGPLLFVSYTDVVADYQKDRLKGMEIPDASGRARRVYGMFAALSFDEGQTWPMRKLISRDPNVPYQAERAGYLSCVQTPDGMVHLLASHGYYRFNLAWLQTPMPAPQ